MSTADISITFSVEADDPMSTADISITFSVEADDPGFIVDAAEDLRGAILNHIARYGMRLKGTIIVSVKNTYGPTN